MDSLAWVDKTYYEKHEGEDASTLRDTYYPNLRQYSIRDGSTHTKSTAEAITMFLMRFGKKAGLSLAVFALSYVPVVGRFVLPAASFYTFKSVAGLGPAGIVFGTGIFLPRRYLVIFLQSYFASRSLMRELVRASTPQPLTPLTDSTLSSSPTSLGSISQKSKRNIGSTIEKAFCLASVSDFTSSYEFLSSVSSSTESLRLRLHT